VVLNHRSPNGPVQDKKWSSPCSMKRMRSHPGHKTPIDREESKLVDRTTLVAGLSRNSSAWETPAQSERPEGNAGVEKESDRNVVTVCLRKSARRQSCLKECWLEGRNLQKKIPRQTPIPVSFFRRYLSTLMEVAAYSNFPCHNYLPTVPR